MHLLVVLIDALTMPRLLAKLAQNCDSHDTLWHNEKYVQNSNKYGIVRKGIAVLLFSFTYALFVTDVFSFFY